MFGFTDRDRFPCRIFVASTALAIAVAILAPSGAHAGCNQLGKGRDCKNVVSLPSNTSLAEIYGTNFHFGPDVLLLCTSAATNAADSGDYFCGEPPAMFLSTSMLTGLFSHRFRDICHSLMPGDGEDGFLLTPDTVSYGWTDDCTDGDCAIEVRAEFSGPEVEALTGTLADRLSMVMHGKAYEAAEADPFAADQTVIVERIGLMFFRPGSKRNAGTCDWYTDLTGNQASFGSWDE
jgi:hypothetical protein